MATKKKNWAQEWLEISKVSRKLAKRANQRLVRLERYAKRPGFSKVLSYAYQGAQQYISNNLGGTRYKEHVKLYDINDGTKNLTGEELYKANVQIQRQRIKAMNEFLEADSSTLGKSRAGTITKGIAAIYDKRTQTINDKFLSKYGEQMSENDLKRFFESKKQAKLEKVVSSSLMFVVAAVIKKENLQSNKRELEKYMRSHIVLDDLQKAGLTKEDLKSRAGESYKEYLDRLQDFVKFTNDEALNAMVTKALKEGINARNIFI